MGLVPTLPLSRPRNIFSLGVPSASLLHPSRSGTPPLTKRKMRLSRTETNVATIYGWPDIFSYPPETNVAKLRAVPAGGLLARESGGLLSSEYDTHKTVKARFWPWPPDKVP